jgi:two-component system response regulator (stage 0 sporulation protein F)
MIVDDQHGIRLLLSEVFRREGYETLTAGSGKEAFALLETNEPDLILLDMKIPGMDGLEILRRIRTMNKTLKVIMMTAYGELEMIQETKELGALCYFSKPFDIDEIRQKVNSILEK